MVILTKKETMWLMALVDFYKKSTPAGVDKNELYRKLNEEFKTFK